MSFTKHDWDPKGLWAPYTPGEEAPKLLDLQDGDLKMTTDFRRVYANVLEDGLGLPSKPALGETFAKLPLFRS
jgi:uncharacterized protein (DUF1501 family)